MKAAVEICQVSSPSYGEEDWGYNEKRHMLAEVPVGTVVVGSGTVAVKVDDEDEEDGVWSITGLEGLFPCEEAVGLLSWPVRAVDPDLV